jgi:hypothetical protein
VICLGKSLGSSYDAQSAAIQAQITAASTAQQACIKKAQKG